MDGWTPLGKTAVCALCNAELPPAADDGQAEHDSSPTPRADAADRFASFLGAERTNRGNAAETLGITDDARSFCKDCRHFLKHPFIDKCLFHQRPTNPMDDCPDLSRREPEANNTSEE
jgi:hypothetical protein